MAARKAKTDDVLLERVVRTEERLVAMDERHADWRKEIREANDNTAKRLDALEESLHKYRGAWGAVVLVMSAVGIALSFFKDYIFRKLGIGS